MNNMIKIVEELGMRNEKFTNKSRYHADINFKKDG